ncbi:hypothetical protein MHL_2686 [Mesomycoplasma hyopneumoniae 7422]|nr:hypothetical protein MHL_2686 [Mesomycoplasma hyopneumoniae 7422]
MYTNYTTTKKKKKKKEVKFVTGFDIINSTTKKIKFQIFLFFLVIRKLSDNFQFFFYNYHLSFNRPARPNFF